MLRYIVWAAAIAGGVGAYLYATHDPYDGAMEYSSTVQAKGGQWGVQRMDLIDFDGAWLVDARIVALRVKMGQTKLNELAQSLCQALHKHSTGDLLRDHGAADVFRINVQAAYPDKQDVVREIFPVSFPVSVEDGTCVKPGEAITYPRYPAPLEHWELQDLGMTRRDGNNIHTMIFDRRRDTRDVEVDGFDYEAACAFVLKDPYARRAMQRVWGMDDAPDKLIISARKTFRAGFIRLFKGGNRSFDLSQGACGEGQDLKA